MADREIWAPKRRAHPPGRGEREAAFGVLLTQLKAWTIEDGAVDAVHDAARASLNEVKALTEYEDGKVSRLLTVVAFLSAVVGAVFTRFATDYGWPRATLPTWESEVLLPAATYGAFIVYVILVAFSVWSLLGAIKPTFNVPATWTGSTRAGLPTSMVFYKSILDVTARDWGSTFETLAGENGKDLKRHYAKCYIAESYLVAEKVAEKLAKIRPGLFWLRNAIFVLMIFFALYGATVIFVAPTRSAGAQAGAAGGTTAPATLPSMPASPSRAGQK